MSYRQLHFICLDGDNHQVVQILRTRYKKTLLKYFGRFSLQARANVKTVTMDLNFYYQDIVRACFPNAQIVIDRFHMIQMLTRSFNSLRFQVMKTFDKRSRQYQLLKYFGRFSLQARANVKTVTMDLNFYYQDIVRACFPNAQIVIDRFHMIQMLTRSFNSLRFQVMKTFDKRSRQYQLLKSPWKLYLKKFDELEKVHPHYNWHYKDCLTQAQVVTEGINTSTTLENSYNLMQSFIQAVETGNTHELNLLINCQDQIGTLMHKTLLTFKHNLKAVLNGAKLPYSNGCLEGFNRKLNLSIRKKVDKNIVMFLSTFIL